MTPRTSLPSQEDVVAAQTVLLAECAELGTRPTVIALARRLGLTNPTFWRHFPQNAEQVAAAGRRVYWETCGNPDGRPAVVLHGGPGGDAQARTKLPDDFRPWSKPTAVCGATTALCPRL